MCIKYTSEDKNNLQLLCDIYEKKQILNIIWKYKENSLKILENLYPKEKKLIDKLKYYVTVEMVSVFYESLFYESLYQRGRKIIVSLNFNIDTVNNIYLNFTTYDVKNFISMLNNNDNMTESISVPVVELIDDKINFEFAHYANRMVTFEIKIDENSKKKLISDLQDILDKIDV